MNKEIFSFLHFSGSQVLYWPVQQINLHRARKKTVEILYIPGIRNENQKLILMIILGITCAAFIAVITVPGNAANVSHTTPDGLYTSPDPGRSDNVGCDDLTPSGEFNCCRQIDTPASNWSVCRIGKRFQSYRCEQIEWQSPKYHPENNT